MKFETPAKKKKGACIFWAPVFFRRENEAILTRCYLQNRLKKIGACVLYLAGKLKPFKQLLV